jgi:hypothetical protein
MVAEDETMQVRLVKKLEVLGIEWEPCRPCKIVLLPL